MTDADPSRFFRPVNTPIYDMVANGSLEQAMTDRGAIGSIAEALHGYFCLARGDNTTCLGPTAKEVDTAQAACDRLTADGYSVVKTDWEYVATAHEDGPSHYPSHNVLTFDLEKLRRELPKTCRIYRRRPVGEWEPVPEGSEE